MRGGAKLFTVTSEYAEKKWQFTFLQTRREKRQVKINMPCTALYMLEILFCVLANFSTHACKINASDLMNSVLWKLELLICN
jgi:hypothetical protein